MKTLRITVIVKGVKSIIWNIPFVVQRSERKYKKSRVYLLKFALSTNCAYECEMLFSLYIMSRTMYFSQ